MEINNNIYICDVCNHSFSSNSHLVEHKRTAKFCLKLQNKEKVQPSDVFDNVIKSLDLLDMVFKVEPDADIRFLHYDYLDCLDKEDYIEVAYRTNRGNMIWTNELAPLLPDELLVYPLDNTHQGIFTIGDIKSKIT